MIVELTAPLTSKYVDRGKLPAITSSPEARLAARSTSLVTQPIEHTGVLRQIRVTKGRIDRIFGELRKVDNVFRRVTQLRACGHRGLLKRR